MAHTRPHYLRATLLTLAVLSAVILVLLVRNRADLKVSDTADQTRGSVPSVAPPAKTEDELARELLEKASLHPGALVTAQTVPMWVAMRNNEPIPGSLYQPGQTCLVVENEIVEFVSKEKDHLVLRYAPVRYRKGSTCPKGTIFYLWLKRPT